MPFNSLEYILFLPLIVMGYFALPHRFRWGLLLAASYAFYMYWEVAYALLLLASTAVDYFAAIAMHRQQTKAGKRGWLALSLVVNLGFLVAFKYFDWGAGFVLPIGISFYTFQTLSYTIDVYRGTRDPERHFGIFALYVSFFPQLVSGPIERSTTLLPQLHTPKTVDYDAISNGLKRILWGLFQKMVIADRLAVYVEEVFRHPSAYEGAPVLLAIWCFAIQVYMDFAGYSNIAIGSAQLMGIRLSENFDRPYRARNIVEFWRRWHMTLTNWFRDYVYIPLGGNRKGPAPQLLNVYIVFFLVAIWHGADWKLGLFATAHFLAYLFHRFTLSGRQALLVRLGWQNSSFWKDWLPRIFTFQFVAFAWVIWWASDIEAVGTLWANALQPVNYSLAGIDILHDISFLFNTCALLLLTQAVYLLQGQQAESALLANRSRALRWPVLYLLLAGLLFLYPGTIGDTFIYFQF